MRRRMQPLQGWVLLPLWLVWVGIRSALVAVAGVAAAMLLLQGAALVVWLVFVLCELVFGVDIEGHESPWLWELMR